MAQFILWNWQDDDSTAQLNYRTAGYLPPGVYQGFGVNLASPGGLTLRMSMLNGFELTLTNLTQEFRGMLVTKQGVVIQENADIDLPINAGDPTNPRIDLVILEHEYVQAPGASVGIYQIIQGTPSPNPVAPSLTLPERQIIIGQLYVPAGMAALTGTGVVYTPEPTPVLANDPTLVRTFNDQSITGTKTFRGIKWDIADLATYNNVGNVETLVLPGNRPWYFLDSIGTPTIYANVSRITDFGQGQQFSVTFGQRVRLRSGAGFIGIPASDMLVEVGETVHFLNLKDFQGLNPPGDPLFFVIKRSGENVYTPVKQIGTFKENKSVFTAITNTISGSVLFLPKTGNFFDVSPLNGSPQFIGYLPTMYHNGDVFPNAATEGGTRLRLRYTSTTSLTLNNSLATPVVGYKPLFLPNGGNITFTEPVILEFIEDATHWRLVNITGASRNMETYYQFLLQHTADIATLFAQGLKYAKLYSGISYPAPQTNGGVPTTGYQSNIRSYTLPGNTLVNNGDTLRVVGEWKLPRNNNLNRAILTFGGLQLGNVTDHGGVATGYSRVRIEAELERVNATTGRLSTKAFIVTNPTTPVADPNDAAPTFMYIDDDILPLQTINWANNANIALDAQLGNSSVADGNKLVVELFRI